MKLDSILLKIIRAILFAIPALSLLFYQSSLYPFLSLKTYLFFGLTAVMLFAWMALSLIKKGEYLPRLTKVIVLFLIFILVATVSGILSDTPMRSFWSTPERLTGLITFYHLFIYILALTTFIKKDEWRRYLLISFFAAALVACSALIQRVSPEFFLTRIGARPGGTLGNPAYLSGYLISYIFLGYIFIKQKFNDSLAKSIITASFIVISAAFLLANTRGAILGLFVAIAFIIMGFLFTGFKKKEKVWRILGILVGLVILSAGVVYTTHDSPVWKKIPGVNRLTQFSLDDSSINNRLIEWRLALVGFAENPVLGVGFENFRLVADKHYDPRLLRGGFSDTYFDKPHNVPLEVLSTTGFFGFLAFALLWYAIGRAIIKSSLAVSTKQVTFAAAIGFFVQNCFLFDTFGSLITLALGIAAVSSLENSIDFSQWKFKKVMRSCLMLLSGSFAVLSLYATTSIMRGNLYHYAMLSNFIQDKAVEGLAAYRDAQAIFYPYQGQLSQDALSSVVERVRAAKDPGVSAYAPDMLIDVAQAITEDPYNYFLNISIADARTVFYRLSPTFLEGVEAELDRAERISPRRQQSLFVRAKVKLLRGDREGALSDMKAAIELDPEAAMPYYNYAKLLAQFTQGPEVKMAFEAALLKGYRPTAVSEFAYLGGYFGDAGEYERSYEFFKAAYEMDPANKEYLAKYALTSFYTQRTDEARQLFTHLLKIAPEMKESPNYPVFLEIFKEIGVTPL